MVKARVFGRAAGIACTAASGVILASMDSIGKHLSGELPVMQIVWARYLFHALVVLGVFLSVGGPGFLRMNAPVLQGLRALAMFAVTASLYTAVRTVPLADATAILFFAPVLVTLLAGLLLREQVGARRLMAVAVGFVGVLVIVRPGLRSVEPALLLPLFGAFAMSGYVLLTRHIGTRDSARTSLFYGVAAGSLLLTLLAPAYWQWPEPRQWALMVTMGILGACGHLLLILAFSQVPAAVLSPFLYAQLLFAVVLSVTVFGDVPDGGMILGTLLLVGSGLYIWYREGRSRPASPLGPDEKTGT